MIASIAATPRAATPTKVDARAAAPTSNAAAGSLATRFSDLALSLAESRGELGGMEDRRSYPGDGWARWFDNTSAKLDNAAMDLYDLMPQQRQFIHTLNHDSRALSHSGGQMSMMEERRIPLGYGWANSLDTPIEHARQAVRLLTERA